MFTFIIFFLLLLLGSPWSHHDQFPNSRFALFSVAVFICIRTPSTAGSSDGPFFTEPQENNYTSSGFPSENSSSLGASESATRPVEEERPGDKLDESSRLPVEEQSLGCNLVESSPLSVEEESPGHNLVKLSRHPVQEEHLTDSSDVSSLSRPVQEQCPTGKSQVPLASPIQEESPTGKCNVLLPYSVPEETSPRKLDGAVNGSHTEELCTTRHSTSNQTRSDNDVSLANDNRFSGETQLDSSFNGEPTAERIGPAKHTDAARGSSTEEAIAPFDATEPAEHIKTSIASRSCDKAGALKAALFDGEASKQTWQGDRRRGAPRGTIPITRAVPDKARDRLLQEGSESLTHEMFSVDLLCEQLESELKLSGKNGNRDGALPRVHLKKSSGTSLQLKTPEKPKSAAVPPKSVASNASDVGPRDRPLASDPCGSSNSSTCAQSPCSKESSHRKAQHSREDAIPEGALPVGAVANANEAMRTAFNGEASPPGDHRAVNPGASLSSGTQSSADENSIAPIIDDNPEDDRKGHQTCEPECCLM